MSEMMKAEFDGCCHDRQLRRRSSAELFQSDRLSKNGADRGLLGKMMMENDEILPQGSFITVDQAARSS